MSIWLIHNNDAYEVILKNGSLQKQNDIIRYPNRLHSRGELVNLHSLDTTLQELIIERVLNHFNHK